jgi:hypothetical protein
MGNRIVTIKVVSDGRIYFRGYHAKSSSGITYHTTGFTLTLKKSDDKDPSKISNRLNIDREEDDGKAGYMPETIIEDDMLTTDTYLLHSDDVIEGLLSLLKKEGYTNQQAYKEISKGVTVYFSNIFEVIDRNTKQRIGTEQYYSYKDIINAVYDLTGTEWSKLTKEILGAYYDNPIQIKLTPYTYNVLYVDAQDYASKGTKATTLFHGESNQLVMFGQKAQADLLPPSSLVYKGAKYKYSGADYVYSNGLSNSSNAPSLSNDILSAYHGYKSDATLYVLLKKDNSIVTPTVTPTTSPTPPVSVTPTVTENSISHFNADSIGVIQTDTSKTAGYNAITGIPTTEYLYGSIQTAEYLLNIQYQIKTGQITYPITVSKTYYREKPSEETSTQTNPTQSNTTNKGSSGKPNSGTTTKPAKKTETEAITVTQSGSVTRSYQYTEIVSIDYFKILNGTLTNATLPGTTITLTPDGYTIPNLSYDHFEGQANHILAPSNAGGTITLSSETVTEIPSEDLVSQGASQVGSIQVRNDNLTFDAKSVLNSSWTNQSAAGINANAITRPSRTASHVLYKGSQQIGMTLANGNYTSSGTITYQRVTSFQSTMPATITYPISVNSVQLHTPVYCEPQINQDNKTYLQLMNPDLSCIPLIIDENPITSDFILHISNQGYHSGKTGYGTQDYSEYVAIEDGKPRITALIPLHPMMN